MKAKQATRPGTCPICKTSYNPGQTLLLSDDGKNLQGCGACSVPAIKAKIARLTAGRLRFEAHPGPKKFKCEACGSWGETGEMRAKVRVPGEQWPMVVACPRCPDLTEQDRAAIVAGPTAADQEKQQRKAAADAARFLTPEEAKDPEALRARQGNWAVAWDALQLDPSLPAMAERRQVDLVRMASAFSVLCIGSPELRECSHMSLLNSFRTAVELGAYPGKGPTALAYLIARGGEATLQPGYKLYADLILSIPSVRGLNAGIAWSCEAVLGNLAAPYHAVLRAAREALRQGKPYDPRLLQAAEESVKARGAAVLAQLEAGGGTLTPTEGVNHLALIAGLKLNLLNCGMNWWEWEWFRYHSASDLVVLDLPAPGLWARPEIDNAKGILPSSSWVMVTRRGAGNVAAVVDARTVCAIAVKGKNAKLNAHGGLDGDVWGDNQSAPHMWAKTALIQVSTHGRLPLRQADPERVAILERLELPESESVEGDLTRAYATMAGLAAARAAELRQHASSVSESPRAALVDGGDPGPVFEFPPEREKVLAGPDEEAWGAEEPSADQGPPVASPEPERDPEPADASDTPSAAELVALEGEVGPEFAAAARTQLKLTATANLERLTEDERIQLARALERNLPPDARRWS